MRILLVNDDGYFCKGILSMARALQNEHEVAIVAPIKGQSCASHRITIDQPLRVIKIKEESVKCPLYAIDGTPVDCVKLALKIPLFDKPDLVISGINKGYNLGIDHIYSGTIAIAIEANINNIPALAVSYGSKSNNKYDMAAGIIAKLIPQIKEKEKDKLFLYSINFPYSNSGEYKGIKTTRLGGTHYEDMVSYRVDPRGQGYYWLALDPNSKLDYVSENYVMTDMEAVYNNFISVAPISFDFTDHDKLATMSDEPFFLED